LIIGETIESKVTNFAVTLDEVSGFFHRTEVYFANLLVIKSSIVTLFRRNEEVGLIVYLFTDTFTVLISTQINLVTA
jgi:hypothetical protein